MKTWLEVLIWVFLGYLFVRVIAHILLQIYIEKMKYLVKLYDRENYLLPTGSFQKSSILKVYKKAVSLGALLLYWPFVSWFMHKEIFAAFNEENRYLDWDPNPYPMIDLRRGSARNTAKEFINRPIQEIKQAIRVFECLEY